MLSYVYGICQKLDVHSWLKMTTKLSSLILTSMLFFCVATKTSCSGNLSEPFRPVLNLLVTAPLPPSDGGWDGGLAVIPAVRLALKQINNHSDILPNYTLSAIEDDSGCRVEDTASISLITNVYYSDRKIVGVIGPGCSGATLLLAPVLAQPKLNLIQIAPSATSPLIERLDQPTTFTMRAPLQIVNNTVDLLRENKWSKYAILYDPGRSIFRTLHDEIVAETNRIGIDTSFSSIVTDHDDDSQRFFPLQELKDSRSRIILLIAGTLTTQRIICAGSTMEIVYPTYQWVIVEKTLDEVFDIDGLQTFKADGIPYNCSKEQMVRALNGSIIIEYSLRQSNDTLITPLNITYRDYRRLYTEEFLHYLNEPEIQSRINASQQSEDYFIRDDYWENPYYDAAWVYALALHEVAKKGVDLSSYGSGQENITNAILDEFFSINFQGASSHIQFSSTRNVLSSIITSQLNGSGSKLNPTQLCTHNGTISCVTEFTAIEDSFEEIFNRMHPSLAAIIITATLGIVIFTVCLHITFTVYRKRKSVKATSPNLSHLIFSGCYLYSIATVLCIVQQVLPFQSPVDKDLEFAYSILCNIVMWCVVIGASLIFGTVLVKVWRILRLFRHFRNQRPGILLSDKALASAVLFLVVIDCVFCVCWSVIDPYITSTLPGDTIQGTRYIQVNVQCNCENVYIWVGVVLGLKVPIIILLVLISTLNRKIQRKHFSHTKMVNILVYSLTILCGVGFPIFFILLELNSSVYVSVLFCFILLVSVVLCCVLLFVQPLRHLKEEVRTPSTKALVKSAMAFALVNIDQHT